VLFASAAIVIGLHWDIAGTAPWPRHLLEPPHVLEQVAASVGLLCGWRVLYTSFWGTDADRAASVRRCACSGPLGGWCARGYRHDTSAPFDDWWHSACGLDGKSSPPHVFLLNGMVSVQLGAIC
jgi:hypothetical protein